MKEYTPYKSDEKPFSCSKCEKKFSLQHNLKTYERIHTDERPFSCSKCEKKFSDAAYLKRHERIHTNERPNQCTTRLKCFRRKCHLIKHNKKIHQIYDNFMAVNEMKSAIAKKQIVRKNFDCQTCYKRFDKPSKLNVHETIPTGEKPYKCKV